MYRVMIVDDEALERQGLLLILDKQFGKELEIIDVSNGKKAIEMAYQVKPEFVFMDMKMPGIDGIEAIKAIKEISPNTKFVVVSAYDSFYYAQKAINANVFAYLLKPVKRKDIIECMDNLLKSQKVEITRMHDELELRQQIQELKPFYEQEFIQSIVYNNSDKLKSLSKMQLLEHRLDLSCCVLLEIDLEHVGQLKEVQELNFLKKRIEEKISQYFKDYTNSVLGRASENRFLGILAIDPEEDLNIASKNVSLLAERLVRNIKAETGIDICVGIGQVVENVDRIGLSYQESLKALTDQSLNSQVTLFSLIENPSEAYREYPFEEEKMLCEKVLLGLKEDAEGLYDYVFQWIHTEIQDMEEKRIKFLEFITVLDRQISEKINESDWRSDSRLLLDRQLDSQDVLKLKTQLWNEISNVIHKINLLRDNNMDSIINKAKSYIQKNYVHEISLEEIAQHVAVSPYYFSKLFKQETGENFIDYLTQVRIEKAKEMLRTTDLSMKMIARRVGYKDPNYFSRVFKKVTKMKPSDFKQK